MFPGKWKGSRLSLLKNPIIPKIRNLPIFFIAFISGCAGVMDFESPGMRIRGVLQEPAVIHYTQPYDKSGMFQILKDPLESKVPLARCGQVNVDGNGEFELELEGFRRGGMFWVVPPLGTVGIDESSEVILTIEGHSPRGIVADRDKSAVHFRDPLQKNVVIDKTGLIVIEESRECERDDPISPGRKVNYINIRLLRIMNSMS